MAVGPLLSFLFLFTTNPLHIHPSNTHIPVTVMAKSNNDDWVAVPTRRVKKPKRDDSSLPHHRRLQSATASSPFVLVLVGLPGSGKSSFASRLETADPRFVRVNQDVVSEVFLYQFVVDSRENIQIQSHCDIYVICINRY